MPRNQTTPHFQHPDNAAFRNQLREAIKSRKIGKKEMKVGKPVDLQLTSECECAICLDPLSATNISVTPCGHKFCFTCLAENMRRSQKCPMCRAELAKPAKGKQMDDEKFSEIQFEEADIAYTQMRRVTRGLNHIFREHSFLAAHVGLAGMDRHTLTICPDNWYTRREALMGLQYNTLEPEGFLRAPEELPEELPEHLQALGNYAEEEEEHQTMYEFNESIREHPRVGGLRLYTDADRSSAPSPETNDDAESDSGSESSSESDSDSESEEEEDIIDEVIDDMETDDGKPMWSYERKIMRLILEARAEGMSAVCDWYEDTPNNGD